jgi:hypothetical protein
MNIDELLEQIAKSEVVITTQTSPFRLFVLLSQLQLALRHPGNTGASALIARQIAENMADILCQYVPEARELIEMGWDDAHDVSREYFDAEF